MVFLPIVKTRYRLKTSPGRDGLLTLGVSCFSQEQVVRMEVTLPPSFLLLVKEQVACMKDLMGELHKLSLFGIILNIQSN